MEKHLLVSGRDLLHSVLMQWHRQGERDRRTQPIRDVCGFPTLDVHYGW